MKLIEQTSRLQHGWLSSLRLWRLSKQSWDQEHLQGSNMAAGGSMWNCLIKHTGLRDMDHAQLRLRAFTFTAGEWLTTKGHWELFAASQHGFWDWPHNCDEERSFGWRLIEKTSWLQCACQTLILCANCSLRMVDQDRDVLVEQVSWLRHDQLRK